MSNPTVDRYRPSMVNPSSRCTAQADGARTAQGMRHTQGTRRTDAARTETSAPRTPTHAHTSVIFFIFLIFLITDGMRTPPPPGPGVRCGKPPGARGRL